MDFTTRQLRGFHLVAQHRSFSRAAEALFITPSGLSLLIRELEAQLGFRLFDRTTRQVQLTRYGTDLLAITQPAVQQLDTAIARLSQQCKGISRTVSVGVTPLVAANVLPGAIREFRGQRPDVRVRLYDGDLKAILRRVEAGKLDLGIGIFPPVPELRRTPVFQFSLVLIRAEQGAVAARPALPWAQLDGQALISLSAGNPTQEFVDRQLTKAGVSCPHEPVVNLLDTQVAMVEANEGIAVIPSFGLPLVRGRRVNVTQLVNPVVHQDFHQISSRAREQSPELVEFAGFLQSYMSRWAERSGVV
jgi:LysR family transcriptional regulator, carnitine catabolism transcriptional activator